MQIAEAFVAVRAQVNPSQFKGDVTRGISQPMAQAGADAGKKAGQEAGKGVGVGLKSQASSVRTSLASLFAGAVFAKGVKGAIDAASALQEQVSATGQIFGDASEDVDAFAKSAAQALGQSEVEARKATNSFGALFRSFGTSETQAAQFGITLSTLASDLASFRDTPIEDAFTALQSGLVGEAEPLRRFGISLSEARLQAEALSLGLVKGKGPLDASAKAQAALSIILKDTTLAQGDFNRTRDSAANTERRAAAEIANTSAKLGQNLLPAYQRFQAVIGTLANTFGRLGGPIQTAIIALAGLAIAAGPINQVSKLVGNLSTKVTDLATTAPRASAALRGVGIAGAATGGVLLLANAISQLDDEASATSTELSILEEKIRGVDAASSEVAIAQALGTDLVQTANDIKTLFDTFDDPSGVQQATESVNQFFGGLTGAESSAQNAQKRIENYDKAFASLATNNLPLAKVRFEAFTEAMKAQGVTTEQLAGKFPLYETALRNADNATQDAASSGDVYKDGLNAIGSEADATATKLTELADSLFATRDAQLDAADAGQNLSEAQTELNELRETAAGRGPAQAAAQERIAAATRKVTDATEAAGDAVRDLESARKDLADFESGGDKTIRDLERQEIVKRKVTTSDEARQKQLDLLKFDQAAAEERQRLQDGVADAEGRVEDAAQAVKDAQDDVTDANREREAQQLEAAGKIVEAEREVERAAIDIATQYAEIVDKQGAASAGAAAYRAELEKAAPVLAGIVDLATLLAETAPKSAGLIGPSPEAAANIRAGKPGGIGIFQAGGIVPGTGPQLAVVHGGETITPAGQQPGGVSVNMPITFVGGDIPTVTQLDATARKLAIRLGTGGPR